MSDRSQLTFLVPRWESRFGDNDIKIAQAQFSSVSLNNIDTSWFSTLSQKLNISRKYDQVKTLAENFCGGQVGDSNHIGNAWEERYWVACRNCSDNRKDLSVNYNYSISSNKNAAPFLHGIHLCISPTRGSNVPICLPVFWSKQMCLFAHLITNHLPITNSLLMSMLTRADQNCE